VTHPAGNGGPSISVALATHNGGAFLGEQLSSLARQTRLPDELVLSDDGSLDDTLAMAKVFAATAPFPVVILENQQKKGYARNFIGAAQRCRGDLIFFADQDDVWRDDKIATIAAVAAASDELALFHDLTVFSGGPEPNIPSYYAHLHGQGFPPAVCFKGCSIALKRGFIERWGWPPEDSQISHDFWIALLSSAFGQRRNVDRVLVEHRIHGRNSSAWIASPGDRVWSFGAPETETALLIDLCLKSWNLGWTEAFLQTAYDRGVPQDPLRAFDLIDRLKQNRARYHQR
jgi:glycosyltransferase involved in cell wall biosynthesis